MQRPKLQKPEIIKSISYSQEEILKWIIRLYCPDGFDLDPTYSKGVFYKNGTKEVKITYLTAADENILTSQNLIQKGKLVDTFNLKSHGRIGMWSVLPPFMGFIGTNIGTLLILF